MRNCMFFGRAMTHMLMCSMMQQMSQRYQGHDDKLQCVTCRLTKSMARNPELKTRGGLLNAYPAKFPAVILPTKACLSTACKVKSFIIIPVLANLLLTRAQR